MKYHIYRRIQFCYHLLAFVGICASIAFAIVAVTVGSPLYGIIAAVSVMITALSVKRSEEYQTKIDKCYE